MINRIVDFSVEHRFVVFLLVAATLGFIQLRVELDMLEEAGVFRSHKGLYQLLGDALQGHDNPLFVPQSPDDFALLTVDL